VFDIEHAQNNLSSFQKAASGEKLQLAKNKKNKVKKQIYITRNVNVAL
jgi:hypothetical protein